MKRNDIFKKIAVVAIFVANMFAIQAKAIQIEYTNDHNLNSIPSNLIQLSYQHPECEFLDRLIKNYDVFLDIYKNCNYQFFVGCGSYLFDGQSYEYCEKMYEKQKLLYETAKKCGSLLEIGVYMGHSIFIVLLANPDIEITCIDIDDFYSGRALDVISKKFNKKIDFIKNDSLVALPLITKKFDMFHIDGFHSHDYLEYDFAHCIRKCSKKTAFFVIDDYDVYPNVVNNLLKSNYLYNVINYEIPNCSWRNVVFEVLLNE